MGDPGKLLLLEEVLNVIKQQNLLENVRKTGEKLKAGLVQLQNEFPSLVNSARGRGTFLAINVIDHSKRDIVLNKLKQKGIQSGGCGDHSIRLRCALVFQEHHADIFLEKFRQVLKEM